MTNDIDELMERLDRATAFIGYIGTPVAHGKAIDAIEQSMKALKSLQDERDALRKCLIALNLASIKVADAYNQAVDGTTDNDFISLLYQQSEARTDAKAHGITVEEE